MLRDTFFQLAANYVAVNEKLHSYWIEIEVAYSNTKRQYHTLQHLAHVFQELCSVKDSIQNWEAILFALFYHDYFYNTLRSDNEVKSAEFAAKRMTALKIPPETIKLCVEHIHATKFHSLSFNEDINFFTDADLSILGTSWNQYTLYYGQIRKEFVYYPQFIYVAGRKKVLEHFLVMKRIYKTDFFFNQYEQQARKNLEQELKLLTSIR